MLGEAGGMMGLAVAYAGSSSSQFSALRICRASRTPISARDALVIPPIDSL